MWRPIEPTSLFFVISYRHSRFSQRWRFRMVDVRRDNMTILNNRCLAIYVVLSCCGLLLYLCCCLLLYLSIRSILQCQTCNINRHVLRLVWKSTSRMISERGASDVCLQSWLSNFHATAKWAPTYFGAIIIDYQRTLNMHAACFLERSINGPKKLRSMKKCRLVEIGNDNSSNILQMVSFKV